MRSRFVQRVRGLDPADVSIVFTLFMLIIKGHTASYVENPVRILCLAGLIYRPLCRKALFWFALAGMLIIAYAWQWHSVHNNLYLIVFWLLALGFSFLSEDPVKVLKTNARTLIGCAFLFAAGHKALSADYMDTSFFHYCLLLGHRFKEVAHLLGGLPWEALEQNVAQAQKIFAFGSLETTAQLVTSSRIAWTALFLTYWTVILESTIAIAFLWPRKDKLHEWHDLPLLLFVFTTYSVAVVIPFALVLISMGVVQAAKPGTRYAFMLAFCMVQFYRIPWLHMLLM